MLPLLVIFVTAGSEKVRVYHLIVKSQPQNEVARRFLQPSHTFEKVSYLVHSLAAGCMKVNFYTTFEIAKSKKVDDKVTPISPKTGISKMLSFMRKEPNPGPSSEVPTFAAALNQGSSESINMVYI